MNRLRYMNLEAVKERQRIQNEKNRLRYHEKIKQARAEARKGKE